MNKYELVISGGQPVISTLYATTYEVTDSPDGLGTGILFLDENDDITAECRVAAGHSYSIVLQPTDK